jgi:phosphoribosyl-AMP cyclohydrolase
MNQERNEIEEGCEVMLDFAKLEKIFQTKEDWFKETKLLPVAVQEIDNKNLLFVAYANREALAYSLTNKIAAFWSTSRNELWVKGLTSDNYLEIIDIRVNCEQNSLLYIVKPKNTGVCHTKDVKCNFRSTCYYRRLSLSEKRLVHLALDRPDYI